MAKSRPEHGQPSNAPASLRESRERLQYKALVYFDCGCQVTLDTADEIVPRVGLPLWCFNCRRNVTVERVTR